jgi:hypothetical protein
LPNPNPAPGVEPGTTNPSTPDGPRQRDDETALAHGSIFAEAAGAKSNPVARPPAAIIGMVIIFNFIAVNLPSQ